MEIDLKRISKIFLLWNGIWIYVKNDMVILRVQEYRQTLSGLQKRTSKAFKY